MRTRVGVLAIVAAVAALLTSGAQGGPLPEPTLQVDVVGAAVTLDPAYATGTASWQYQYATALKLYNLPDATGAAGVKPVPEAAAGPPKVSKDRRTYTFTLRPKQGFSDGKAVTAASFADAIQRARTQAIAPGSRFVADVASVNARGNTLTVKLKQPAPDFLARLTMPFFSAIPTSTPPAQQTGLRPTAGPYYPKAFVGGGLVLERNPYYRGKRLRRPAAIQLNFGIARDKSLARCEAGQADVCSPPDESVTALAAKYGVNKGRFFVNQTMTTNFFALNTSRPLFRNNTKLRQAVNLAIDRQKLIAAQGPLSGRATDQFLPPGMPGFRNAQLYGVNRVSLAKARALAQGNTRSGKAIFYTFDSGFGPSIAQVVQFNLKQIGIDVGIKTIPTAQYASRVRASKEPYDIALWGWTSNYPDPYDFINILLHGNGIQSGTNLSYFDNAPYNRRIEAASKLSGTARYRAFGSIDVDVMRTQAPVARTRTRMRGSSSRAGSEATCTNASTAPTGS